MRSGRELESGGRDREMIKLTIKEEGAVQKSAREKAKTHKNTTSMRKTERQERGIP